jgi:predicted dehydrogenase
MHRRGFLATLGSAALAADKFRLVIAGLTHGHARGFLRQMLQREDVELVGIAEPSVDLHQVYSKSLQIPERLFARDLGKLLDAVKPHAVAAFTSTYEHPGVVKECAARKLPVMMEKPLAVSNEHAQAIASDAARTGIPVVVNYETTWYRSHAAQYRELVAAAADSKFGSIRKMVAMDGHQGPKEIGVGPEFLSWLTDPEKNGAGALFDFGCYGANLMTWLMKNQRPQRVSARVQTFKPHIYRRVDDEATILVEYAGAQGIIQGSWNWPYSRKDLEVYTERGYAHAIGGNRLRVLRPGVKVGQEEVLNSLPELSPDERDPVSYLKAVAEGRLQPAGLSSLENNLIATEILVAARESARSGRVQTLR